MAAGLFGAIGYDMVRLVEDLPNVNPDPLGLPDGVMPRPSIVAVFDSIGQEIILATTALFVTTARAFGRRAFLADLGIGFVMTSLIYFAFDRLLTLSLPAGPLERLL